LGYSKNSLKREVYSNIGLPQEARKISNKQPSFTLKELKKEQRMKPKASRRKITVNITEEINEIEKNNKENQ